MPSGVLDSGRRSQDFAGRADINRILVINSTVAVDIKSGLRQPAAGAGIHCHDPGVADRGRDFLEPNNLTFFVMVIKNWCLCPSLINIFNQVMTNKIWRFYSRLGTSLTM